MSASDNLSNVLFHGTDAKVKEGGTIKQKGKDTSLWMTTHPEDAASYGKHVYQVEPQEDWDISHHYSGPETIMRDGKPVRIDVKHYTTAFDLNVVKKIK